MDENQPKEGRKRVLVVAPHADDAELGLGGYLHREISGGRTTARIVVVAETGPSRKTEQFAAAKYLDIENVHFLAEAKDSEFNLAPMGRLVKRLEDVIFNHGHYDELFVPLPSFHEDHDVTHRACVAALRPHKGRQFPSSIFCYEYPAQSWGPQVPAWGRVYAPLSRESVDAKLAALKLHGSQWVSDDQSLFGRKGVLSLANMRGAECLTDFAELFYVLRGVK